MTTTAMRPLADMQAEVVAWCWRKGWRQELCPFEEAMALLHTEIAESSDAWRRWLLEDATGRVTQNHLAMDASKPEGVGSGFADIVIRLFDYCDLYKVDLQAEVDAHHGRYGVSSSFLTNMNTLHTMVAKASMAYDADDWPDEPGSRGGWTWRRQLGTVYVFLTQLCEAYGIDLQAEYDRKMAYNESRPWRHGNKQA